METYKIPKKLTVKDNKSLSPIFRDTAELTAHHSLSEKIQEAVKHSRVLIVLCSPAAQTSHWVNEEIRLFRRLHGEASILCVLSEGTPDTSFPPALLEGGREPLAANLSGGRESFRLGVTQLAASMLGVGLDQLIQRDAKRRRNRLRIVSMASLGFAAVMGGMAWTAIDARDAADLSRTEAEKMVEFMLTDLKQDLEPIGKLDILDDVGKRVSDYYGAIPLSDMNNDRLARQARARHLLGQVALDQGENEKAKTEIEAAYDATAEVLRQNPDDTEAIFAHAQSAYWVGAMSFYDKNYTETMPYWQTYTSLADILYKNNPHHFDWIMEKAWSFHNIALLHYRLKSFEIAEQKYLEAVKYFELALKSSPENSDVETELASSYSGLARTVVQLNNLEKALAYRNKQIAIYNTQLLRQPNNYQLLYRRTQAQSWLVRDGLLDNKPDELRLTINQSIQTFIQLLDHDPKNTSWKINYKTYLEFLFSNDFNKSKNTIPTEKIKALLSDIK